MSYTQKSFCSCTVSHSPEHSVQLLGFKSKQLYAVCNNAAMPPRRKLSGFDRGRAIGWVQDGVPKREVARRLQVSMSVIVRLTQRFNATGSVQERPRTGRPKKTTQREDRYISRQALQTRTASASNIRRQLLAAQNNNVSEQTIRRRFRGFQLRSRRPAVRPRLTQAHRVARLAFSRHHLRWTRQQWATVLFSDESRFVLNHNDGRLRVWRCDSAREGGSWWRFCHSLGGIQPSSQDTFASCAREPNWSSLPGRNPETTWPTHTAADGTSRHFPRRQRPTSQGEGGKRLSPAIRGPQNGLASLQSRPQSHRKSLG